MKKVSYYRRLRNNLIFNKVNKNNLRKIYKNSISNIIKIQNINKKSIKISIGRLFQRKFSIY